MSYTNKGNLTQGDIRTHLIRLTVPMIWGMLAIISFSVVDTWFVSRLGDDELAAMSFTFPVTMFVFNLIIGQSIAMSSVVSRAIGSGNHTDIERFAAHGMMIAFLSGIVFAVLGISFMDLIFKALGTPDTLMPLVDDYMRIWFIGAAFITVPIVGNSAIRATGDTLTPSLIMLLVVLINIILNPVLVFGFLGFPRLEMEGSALATVFANALGMLAGLYILIYKKKIITLYSFNWRGFGHSFKTLMSVAIPVGLTNTILPVVSGVITYILAKSGPEIVAAYGIVSRIEALSFVVLIALSVGMSPIIGQNWGADKKARVQETINLAIRFSVLWSVGVAVLMLIAHDYIARAFSSDPKTIEAASFYMLIVPLTYAFGNLVNGWASAFNAMGMPRYSFNMIMIKMIILSIPAAWLGHIFMDWKGVFISIALVNLLAGILFHLRNSRFLREKCAP